MSLDYLPGQLENLAFLYDVNADGDNLKMADALSAKVNTWVDRSPNHVPLGVNTTNPTLKPKGLNGLRKSLHFPAGSGALTTSGAAVAAATAGFLPSNGNGTTLFWTVQPNGFETGDTNLVFSADATTGYQVIAAQNTWYSLNKSGVAQGVIANHKFSMHQQYPNQPFVVAIIHDVTGVLGTANNWYLYENGMLTLYATGITGFGSSSGAFNIALPASYGNFELSFLGCVNHAMPLGQMREFSEWMIQHAYLGSTTKRNLLHIEADSIGYGAGNTTVKKNWPYLLRGLMGAHSSDHTMLYNNAIPGRKIVDAVYRYPAAAPISDTIFNGWKTLIYALGYNDIAGTGDSGATAYANAKTDLALMLSAQDRVYDHLLVTTLLAQDGVNTELDAFSALVRTGCEAGGDIAAIASTYGVKDCKALDWRAIDRFTGYDAAVRNGVVHPNDEGTPSMALKAYEVWRALRPL